MTRFLLSSGVNILPKKIFQFKSVPVVAYITFCLVQKHPRDWRIRQLEKNETEPNRLFRFPNMQQQIKMFNLKIKKLELYTYYTSYRGKITHIFMFNVEVDFFMTSS